MTPDTLRDYVPILLQFAFVGGFVAFVITASHFLGPKRRSKRKDDTFECGIRIVGNARVPFSVKYFLVAILFVLFDVEVIFFYPWVVNFTELAINGFLSVLLFVSLFLVGFIYIVKRKVLDWEN